MEAIEELLQLSESMRQGQAILADEDVDDTSTASTRRSSTFLNVVALGNVVSQPIPFLFPIRFIPNSISSTPPVTGDLLIGILIHALMVFGAPRLRDLNIELFCYILNNPYDGFVDLHLLSVLLHMSSLL